MTAVIAATAVDLLRGLLIVGLALAAVVIAREVRDAHQRGLARVHAGTSWSPRAGDDLACQCAGCVEAAACAEVAYGLLGVSPALLAGDVAA